LLVAIRVVLVDKIYPHTQEKEGIYLPEVKASE